MSFNNMLCKSYEESYKSILGKSKNQKLKKRRFIKIGNIDKGIIIVIG